MHPDPIYSTVCALALAAILATTATYKLRAPRRLARQLDDYGLLPQALLVSFARLIPLLEATLALTLLLPMSRAWAALGTATLLAGYAFAIAINLWRGRRDMDCGCSGPNQSQPLRPLLLLRNAALVALALIAAQTPLAREMGAADLALSILASVTLLLLYTGSDTLLANASNLRALNGK